MIGRVLFMLAVVGGAAKILLKDERIPRPIRWGLWCTSICLFIPGPFDEAAIAILFLLVAVFWRDSLRDAWRTSLERRPHDLERRPE